jgi:DNA (cytosine-5)-methyltransferase 1
VKKINYPKATHFYDQEDSESKQLEHCVTVGDAIGDLPKITDNWRISEVSFLKIKILLNTKKMRSGNNNSKL